MSEKTARAPKPVSLDCTHSGLQDLRTQIGAVKIRDELPN